MKWQEKLRLEKDQSTGVFVLRLIFFSVALFGVFSLVQGGLLQYSSHRADRIAAEILPEPFEGLKQIHYRLGPPAKGTWLAETFEAGHTLLEFQKERVLVERALREKIYLQALGSLSKSEREIIDLTQEYLAIYFCRETIELPKLESTIISDSARRRNIESRKEQFLTTYILDEVLAPRKPKDAIAYVALTATDLWPGGTWSFVFGQASIQQQTGVWSLARYGEAASSKQVFTKVLRRTLKVASHEIGHVLGVKHCITHQCNMNGSMHLDEADAQPLLLCPHCLAKLMSRRQCSLRERFESLAAFSNRNGLFFDAARFEESAQLFNK